ncbi:MAG: 7-carboxy-7-deazaguanine synthase QueE [Candidatus Omnitrophica bacterium]|nr:7-carboxy-7-deazaguanine synthase QueE [Candidatus Omnitrophota bacterium]
MGNFSQVTQHNRLEITEVFSSIQGEGPRMGERHLFVRFKDCNLDCSYCDEKNKNGGILEKGELITKIVSLEQSEGPHSFISMTGGEPLCYVSGLKSLIPELRERSFKIYLETNGTLVNELTQLIDFIDVIAMDIKLESVGGSPRYLVPNSLIRYQAPRGERLLDVHRRFLLTARSKEVFAKVVISLTADVCEFSDAVCAIASVSPAVPLILQPEDGDFFSERRASLLRLMSEFQLIALKRLRDVKVMPRMHRILGTR